MPAWKLCHTPKDSNNSHHRSHQPCPARPWPKHACFLSYRKPSHKESTLLLHRDQERHDPLLQVLKRSQTICPKPSVQQNWNHVSKSFQHTHPTWNLVAISPSRQLACTGSWLLYKSVSSFFLPWNKKVLLSQPQHVVFQRHLHVFYMRVPIRMKCIHRYMHIKVKSIKLYTIPSSSLLSVNSSS